MTTQTIPISSIDCWGLFYAPGALDRRTEHDTRQIERYKAAIAEGRVPPALVVYEVDGGTRHLADGRHRLVAYRELGRSEAPADIYRVPNAAAASRAAFAGFWSREPLPSRVRRSSKGTGDVHRGRMR